MFWAFKLSFVADILTFFNLVTFGLFFEKIGKFFSNLLVTLAGGQEGRRAGGQEGRRAGEQEGRRAGEQKGRRAEGRRAGRREGKRAGETS